MIKQMKERHEKEIKELQDICEHTNVTDWIEEFWATGHGTMKEVIHCNICGATVFRRGKGWASNNFATIDAEIEVEECEN